MAGVIFFLYFYKKDALCGLENVLMKNDVLVSIYIPLKEEK